ncbi:hypothetical protein CON21_30810 [Bacillus thuringiensis]|uniref:hypothetical protein n=1 Tax=Bacillus thuringiensis TaxID=1428 RepID=UPI000BECF6BB|nr:hypothetical protein [Bacillus thuringiensis]PEE96968.1 hypothetical protein CON21_30810 [Bacillus thuringiensis]
MFKIFDKDRKSSEATTVLGRKNEILRSKKWLKVVGISYQVKNIVFGECGHTPVACPIYFTFKYG